VGCHIWNPVYCGLNLTALISVIAESGTMNDGATKELFRYVFLGNDQTEGDTINIS